MAKLSNIAVIASFFHGDDCESHTGNLYVTGDGRKLMNYSTCLAQRSPDGLIVNQTKYSSTTSKIQYYFKNHMDKNYSEDFQKNHCIIVTNVPKGEGDLTKYITIVK